MTGPLYYIARTVGWERIRLKNSLIDCTFVFYLPCAMMLAIVAVNLALWL